MRDKVALSSDPGRGGAASEERVPALACLLVRLLEPDLETHFSPTCRRPCTPFADDAASPLCATTLNAASWHAHASSFNSSWSWHQAQAHHCAKQRQRAA
eukprot:1146237-Pelagomonas_calceolata.AAC.7